jgi:dolichol-phosphate mannosyltransferase
MSNKQKAVIIIPTYNESAVIAETIHALESHIQAIQNVDVDLLVFDSHSPDHTIDIVKSLQSQYANLHFIVESQKSGLGSAYIKAMHYAMHDMHADIVFEYDADGSHQPQYLKPMLEKLNEGYDVVLGSRYIPGGSIPSDWGFYRQFLSVVGNWVARSLLTWRYRDFTSGFRGTRTSVLRQIKLNELLSRQYAYKIHLLWALHKANAKIVEYPIVFIDREKGYSKLPRNNIIDSLRVVITLRFREIKSFFSGKTLS